MTLILAILCIHNKLQQHSEVSFTTSIIVTLSVALQQLHLQSTFKQLPTPCIQSIQTLSKRFCELKTFASVTINLLLFLSKEISRHLNLLPTSYSTTESTLKFHNEKIPM